MKTAPKTRTGNMGRAFFGDPNSILGVLQTALGLTATGRFTYETVSRGSAGTGHVILLSLSPLIGDQPDERGPSRNVLVRLSTAFHEALVTEGSSTLAAYARGASHHFKNALAGAEWLFGRFPERAGATFEGVVMSSAQRKMLNELTGRALELRDEIAYLKRQADLFFWVMSPERVREPARAGVRRFDAITTEGLIRGIRLGLAHPGSKWSGSDEALGLLLDEVDLCHRVLLDTVRDRASPTAIMPRLQQVLNRHGVALTYRHGVGDAGVSGIAAQIVEAAVVELVQNALKAATACPSGGRQLSVSSEIIPGAKVLITVRNTALENEVNRLRQRFERGGAVTDMSGLWQLELLCRRLALPHGAQVTLAPPSFGADEVEMALEVGIGENDVQTVVH